VVDRESTPVSAETFLVARSVVGNAKRRTARSSTSPRGRHVVGTDPCLYRGEGRVIRITNDLAAEWAVSVFASTRFAQYPHGSALAGIASAPEQDLWRSRRHNRLSTDRSGAAMPAALAAEQRRDRHQLPSTPVHRWHTWAA